MSHLKDNNMSYGQHFSFAVKLSFHLAVISIVGVIHAVVPYFFQNFVSSGVKRMDDLIQEKVG